MAFEAFKKAMAKQNQPKKTEFATFAAGWQVLAPCTKASMLALGILCMILLCLIIPAVASLPFWGSSGVWAVLITASIAISLFVVAYGAIKGTLKGPLRKGEVNGSRKQIGTVLHYTANVACFASVIYVAGPLSQNLVLKDDAFEVRFGSDRLISAAISDTGDLARPMFKIGSVGAAASVDISGNTAVVKLSKMRGNICRLLLEADGLDTPIESKRVLPNAQLEAGRQLALFKSIMIGGKELTPDNAASLCRQAIDPETKHFSAEMIYQLRDGEPQIIGPSVQKNTSK